MKATERTITRRTALAGAAAMIPATAIPALALAGAGSDPAFAAIENYKRSFVFHGECLEKAERLDDGIAEIARATADAQHREGPALYEKYKATPFPPRRVADDDPAWLAFRSAQDAYCLSEHNAARLAALKELEEHPLNIEKGRLQEEGSDTQAAAAWALFETVPTTPAGAAAMLLYVLEAERTGHGIFDWSREIDDESEMGFHRRYGYEYLMASVADFLNAQAAT